MSLNETICLNNRPTRRGIPMYSVIIRNDISFKDQINESE